MYEGKFVAEAAVATPDDVHAALTNPARGSAFLGLLVLLVGLPLLAARVFVWAVVRDIRGVATLASIVGSAVTDARRR